MFYCQKCAEKNKWPDWSLHRSHGPCEICKKTADCFDVPSKYLPIPQAKEKDDDT